MDQTKTVTKQENIEKALDLLITEISKLEEFVNRVGGILMVSVPTPASADTINLSLSEYLDVLPVQLVDEQKRIGGATKKLEELLYHYGDV